MKASRSSSYSMIEPPSVSLMRTAWVTMRLSTSSGSRLELTASPRSRSASSCSTLLASSDPRVSSDGHQLDLPQHDRRLGGEGARRARPPARRTGRPRGARRRGRRPPRRRGSSAPTSGSGSRPAAAGPGARTPGRRGRRRSAGVCRSATTRPSSVPRSRVVGCSSECSRNASGTSREVRDSRKTSPSARCSWPASARQSRTARSIDDVEDLAGVGTRAGERDEDLLGGHGLLSSIDEGAIERVLGHRPDCCSISPSAMGRSLAASIVARAPDRCNPRLDSLPRVDVVLWVVAAAAGGARARVRARRHGRARLSSAAGASASRSRRD